MSLEIVPHRPEHIAAIQRMNARLRAGGSDWRFYDNDESDWIPKSTCGDLNTWREYFVAEDDSGEVRGAYCHKPQRFQLNGKEVWIGTWQGPVSEALVDLKYAPVGMLCIREMLDQYPLHFGVGGSDKLVRLLLELGWGKVGTPALLKVSKPKNFLRQASYIRKTTNARRLLDLLAASGLPSIGMPLIQLNRSRWPFATETATVQKVAEFGSWADEIWEEVQGNFDMIAWRDAATLNALLAAEGWPEVEILKIERAGRVIGWAAIRLKKMSDDNRFGSMTVGSVVDSLALPGEERAVIAASIRILEEQGPDLLFTNYTHGDWRAAFKRCGFIELPKKRLMTISPALVEELGSGDFAIERFHLTPIDGDGPMGL